MSKSYFTVQCWGCKKSETHSPIVGPEADAAIADMEARGWRRRAFWPDSWDKGPWFCGEDCATNSYNAKQAEEYWRQKEFEEYCQKTKVPVFFWLAVGLVGFMASSFLIERCFNAGL